MPRRANDSSNESICVLALNAFALICTIYSCKGIWELRRDFRKLDQQGQEECGTYVTWK